MLITTIEDLIIKIAEIFRSDSQTFSPKDKTVIFSLAAQFKKNLALTQKQAELTMRILENVQSKLSLIPDAENLIKTPVFKYAFRKVDTSKTINILNINSENFIAVKFPFDKKLSNILPNIPGKSGYSKEYKSFLYKLTDKTLINLLDNEVIQNYQFDISTEVQEIYSTIKNIIDNRETYIPIIDYDGTLTLKNSNKTLETYFNNHRTGNILSDLFLAKTLGISPSNKLIDTINSMNLNEKTLDLFLNKTTIFDKTNGKKFIHSNSTITEYIKLVDHWPVLFILSDDDRVDATLNKWHNDLNNIGINNSQISVLFRSTDNIKFNEYIKNHQLNNRLDENIKVVFIRHKIPKILYKINFQPKIIISSSTFYAHYSAQKTIDSHPFVIYMSGSEVA